MARGIACQVVAKDTYLLELLRVFPHALQAQLACWSLFRRTSNLNLHDFRKVIVLPDSIAGYDIPSHWNRTNFSAGIMKLMGLRVEDVLTTSAAAAAGITTHEGFDTGTVMLNNTGWRGAENPWLVDMRGVEELQRRLGLLRGDGRKSVAKDRVRVGIVNRRASRRILGWERLANALASYSSSAISVTVVDDLGDLSFLEAANWVHNKDVIITPHGGQNSNLIWATPCTVVLEVSLNGSSKHACDIQAYCGLSVSWIFSRACVVVSSRLLYSRLLSAPRGGRWSGCVCRPRARIR